MLSNTCHQGCGATYGVQDEVVGRDDDAGQHAEGVETDEEHAHLRNSHYVKLLAVIKQLPCWRGCMKPIPSIVGSKHAGCNFSARLRVLDTHLLQRRRLHGCHEQLRHGGGHPAAVAEVHGWHGRVVVADLRAAMEHACEAPSS